MRSFSKVSTVLVAFVVAAPLTGCGSNTDNGQSGGSGGEMSAGGSSTTTGGSSNVGGTKGTGGAKATGGNTPSVGGSSVTATGGASVSGGSPNTGGSAKGGTSAAVTVATGGAAIAGASATGGTRPTGGSSATAGASSSGGASATGGTRGSGGGTTTTIAGTGGVLAGGASTTGGTTGTAGSMTTGGVTTAGGTTAATSGGVGGISTIAGGASASGGSSNAGGMSGSGGSTAQSPDVAILQAHSTDCAACALSNCAAYLGNAPIDTANGFGSCLSDTLSALSVTAKVATTVATDPYPLAVGTAYSGDKVCLDVLSCIIKTKCAANGVVSTCFCGDAVGGDCVDSLNYPPNVATNVAGTSFLGSDDNPVNGVDATGPINGACFREEIDGRNSTSPSAISGGFGNPAFALGPANQLVTCLLNKSCSACF